MLRHPLGHRELWKAAGLPRACRDTARVAFCETAGGRELLCCHYLWAVRDNDTFPWGLGTAGVASWSPGSRVGVAAKVLALGLRRRLWLCWVWHRDG